MQSIDFFAYRCIGADACSDILVQNGVGEAELFFIALPAEPVNRRFFNQIFRQVQCTAKRLDLCDGQVGTGTEIAGTIAVTRGVANPIF